MKIFNFFKIFILKKIFPLNSVQKILIGPLKSHKIIISENSGWSPLFNRWEPDILYWFTKIIKPNNVIYDLGANNGIHSILASKLVGNNGKIFSFEPLEENIAEIKFNFENNFINNAQIINFAVSDVSINGLKFKIGKHNKQGSIIGIGSETGDEITINSISLNDFVKKGNPMPDFIKIDIEGAESKALDGFNQYLHICLPTLIIDLHTPEQDEKIGKILFLNNYTVFRILKNKKLFKIDNLHNPYPDPNGIWGSILAVHPTNDIIHKL